jgi:hypothetical protein
VDLADLTWVLEVCNATRQGSFAGATRVAEKLDLLEIGPCAENLALQIRSRGAQFLMRERFRRVEKSVTSELLTWLVGKVSAFFLRMRGRRDRITHAKLSTREQRVCLIEHVAKSFQNS